MATVEEIGRSSSARAVLGVRVPEQRERVYSVSGVSTEDAAEAAALAQAISDNGGTTLDDLPIKDIQATEDAKAGNYKVTLTWAVSSGSSPTQQQQGDDSRFEFDFSPQVVRLQRSLETTAYTDSGWFSTAPDFNGAMGLRLEDGKVKIDGIDVEQSAFQWSETVVVALPANSTAWESLLATMAGLHLHRNNATFRGFSAKQILLRIIRGRQISDDDLQIAYTFAHGVNVTGQSVGSITGIAKNAHDYIEFLWTEEEDSGAIVANPSAAYVHRNFDDADFSTIPGL